MNSIVKSARVFSEMNGTNVMLYECDFTYNDFFKRMYNTDIMYIKSTDLYKAHPNLYKQIMEYTKTLFDSDGELKTTSKTNSIVIN